MALDFQLSDQFNQTINVATVSSVDNFGDKTYGAPVAVAARVEFTNSKVQTTDGNFRETTHWIATEQLVTLNDRIWLPGDNPADDTLAREVITIDKATAEDGSISHFEVRV